MDKAGVLISLERRLATGCVARSRGITTTMWKKCFWCGAGASASSSETGPFPRGVEHRTAADDEAEVILVEPAGVLNTANIIDEKFTAPTRARI